MRKFLTSLFIVAISLSCVAQKRTDSAYTPVYMFAVAQSFSDTVCYMSSLQRLDSISLSKDGLLQDRATYSTAFGNYIQNAYGQENTIPSLLFYKSRKTAESTYIRIRNRYMNRKHTRIQEVPASEFQFHARIYDYKN